MPGPPEITGLVLMQPMLHGFFHSRAAHIYTCPSSYGHQYSF